MVICAVSSEDIGIFINFTVTSIIALSEFFSRIVFEDWQVTLKYSVLEFKIEVSNLAAVFLLVFITGIVNFWNSPNSDKLISLSVAFCVVIIFTFFIYLEFWSNEIKESWCE